MSVIIKRVETRKELNAFIAFFTELYRDNKQVAFPLHSEEYKTLYQGKNPAHDFCEVSYWLAYRDNKIVGRIAGIINKKEQQGKGEKLGRFGWFDFIDDPKVSKALMNEAKQWMLDNGIVKVHGPLGFSDMDRQGALIEGFEKPGTMATLYNYPYYKEHLEYLGFRKSTDWIEFEFDPHEANIELLDKLASRCAQVNKCRSLQIKSKSELRKIAPQIFKLVNEGYRDLYGYVSLSEEQIQHYTETFIGFVNPDLISLVVNENDELIGMGIGMYSLTEALQHAKGKLFPLGFLKLMKALKKNDSVDLYLVTIDKRYQGKGAYAIVANDILQGALKLGVTHTETNIQLEDNHKMLTMWRFFKTQQHKRRRCYTMEIA
ncbi:hypothetical protein EYV94_00550 [Puteibacter caeruleilacunae]|nr:hypothetical protein EYV94_00550 [Puteibacter caeruleilacunae]